MQMETLKLGTKKPVRVKTKSKLLEKSICEEAICTKTIYSERKGAYKQLVDAGVYAQIDQLKEKKN